MSSLNMNRLRRLWQMATLHVVFVEDDFTHGIRWPVVPGRIVIILKADGDYGSVSQIGAAPPSLTAFEFQTNVKICMFQ